MQIEICANSIQSAKNACLPGVTRIELCDNLEVGGTTPTAEAVAYCVNQLRLRTNVLLRPREGNFVYTREEIATLEASVRMCHETGASAIVVGFLTPDGTIDEKLTRHFVELASPMEVTFHRAFDEMRQDPLDAIEALIRCGCHRLLTSGCQPTAEQGIPLLRQLVEQASGRIAIMAGSGVTPANVRHIVEATGVNEVHGSCKKRLPDGTSVTDTETVKALIREVKGQG